MGRLSSVLLTGVGVLVLGFVLLSIVGTLVGIALSVVATLLSIVVTATVLGVFALAVVGLVSLLRDDSEGAAETQTPSQHDLPTDPEERLRTRYVDGELSDEEFERELERLFGPHERRSPTGTKASDGVARNVSVDRDR